MRKRAAPHVRRFLGQRLRELRKQRGFSQVRLGSQSSLSGKFISEVERGEKSISIESLYRVSLALGVSLRYLTDIRPRRGVVTPSTEAHEIMAFVSDRRRSARDARRAYRLLQAVLDDD